MQEKCTKYRNNLASLQSKIDTLRENAAQEYDEAEQKVSMYAAEIADAVVEIKKLNDQIDCQKCELESQRIKLQEAHECIGKKAKVIDHLEAEKKSFESELQNFKQVLDTKQKDEGKEKSQLQEAQKEIGVLESRFEEVMQSLSASQLEAKAATDSVKAKDERIKELRSALSVSTEKESELREELRQQLNRATIAEHVADQAVEHKVPWSRMFLYTACVFIR